MDIGRCNVIYLDRRAKRTGLVKKEDLQAFLGRNDSPASTVDADQNIVKQNVEAILETFNDVFICEDGHSCLRRLSMMEDPVSQPPTIVLIDIPDNDDSHIVNPLASNPPTKDQASEQHEPFDIYGCNMLSHICSSIQQRSMSRLTIPVAVTVNAEAARAALEEEPSLWALSKCAPDSVRGVRYLDIGAVDVLTSPLSKDRVQGLTVHAYRVFKSHSRDDNASVLTQKNRKLSWIGIEEDRPFAYLREAMVSNLMVGICTPDSINDVFDPTELKIEEDRMEIVERAVGEWAFSAHDFTSDELVHAARVMLEHALSVPELHQWAIPTDDLIIFVMACRRAYNDFVSYHNFRHVVDVLQAIFYFLLKIGLLPPYQVEGNPAAKPSNAVAAVLRPFDALALLVTALGHDVGHPGVNNAFLVALNAPLAQLYNDRSVLEAFHCAAYSQILRKYWPATFADSSMRKLMITSILATDMGLHFRYMSELKGLQEKIAAAQSNADGWVPKVTDENRDLVCGLLIKCADISNVARKYACAAQWARVLTDEFANQGAMEKELELPTCLFGGPPDPNDFLKLAESQLGFMNIFARPLFEGISHVLPDMRFTLAELSTNKAIWQERIEAENSRKMSFARGPLSPLSRSTATPSETDSIDERAQRSPSLAEIDPKAKSNSNSRSRSISGLVKETGQTSLDPLEESGASPLDENGQATPIDMSRTPVLENNARRHSSVYSRPDGDPKGASRQGSVVDPHLATTIYISTHTNLPEDPNEVSVPPSPSKSTKSVISAAKHGPSLYSSSRSQGTSNNEGDGLSNASTKPSSVEDDALASEHPIPRSMSNGELTYNKHLSRSDDSDAFDRYAGRLHHKRSMKTMSVIGPDAYARATGSPGKESSNSQLTVGGDDHLSAGDHQDLRSSRSQSRLRGLKFWKKPRETST